MSEWVEIGPMDRVPTGSGLRVEAASHRLALFRIEDSVYAIGDRSTSEPARR